jgi:hypothetical protein
MCTTFFGLYFTPLCDEQVCVAYTFFKYTLSCSGVSLETKRDKHSNLLQKCFIQFGQIVKRQIEKQEKLQTICIDVFKNV